MSQSENQNGKDVSSATAGEVALTLTDLLDAESEVLRRIARSQAEQPSMAGHYSSTGGHNMSGSHSSHTMAKVERPLEN